MRRFTYASGSSHKFWSVGRDGATVTVHFGRVGTDGQTQVKELASDGEAEAHVTKLITQKVKKGYAEETTEIEVGPPVVEVSHADPEPADEDAFVLPDRWRELIHPRRGGRFVPVLDGDPARAWQLVDEFRDKVVTVIEKRHGNVNLDTTMDYLDNRTGDPHDAAAVAAVVDWALNKDAEARAVESAAFVDCWVADGGFDFAARAVMARQRVYMNYSALYRHKRGSRNRHDDPHVDPIVGRFRAHLAVASDDDHAAAVQALDECRQSNHDQLVAAFLVPSRADWLDATLAHSTYASPMLVEALGHPDQLAELQIEPYHLYATPTVVPTLVDGLGPTVAPFLADQYDKHAGYYADETKQLLAALAVIPTDEAFDLLLRRVNKRWVRPHLQDAMNRFPVRAARRLAATPANPTAAELLRAHARTHAGLLATADLPDAVRAKLDQFPGTVPEADPATLPALLVEPPWTRKRTAAKPAVVAGLTPAATPHVAWAPGEREEWRAPKYTWGHDDWSATKQSEYHPNQVLAMFRAGQLDYLAGVLMATGPDELVGQLIGEWRPNEIWQLEPYVHRIAARHELDAVPALSHLAASTPMPQTVELLLPFATAELTTLMTDWLARLKSVRQVVRAWFRRHQETAARVLVPAALGKPGKDRRAAEAALRILDPATVTTAAAEYGAEAAAGIATLLATDPLDVLPVRLPKFPAWVTVAALPQLIVRHSGAALPHAAVTHVVTMLAMSKPDEVYAGVDVVTELCTPDSLAEFAWSLFGAWQSADMPAKDGWALSALAWFGDDETVRRLTPLIRAWPGEGGHARAVAGLDVLAAIGTDVALMHLHGIAQKVKFAGLRTKAQEKIAQVAAELELTPDQLADRLVPDLGLDDDGSMVLDYGPRQFVVGFDERLTPYAVDDTGTRRKDLPKPGARDDAELAPAAHKRFAALKKDVRTLAADQVRRLQQAMVAGRRWTATEFTDLFVGHPLLRHVVRRLVWAHFEGDDPVLTFRVAEDRTLAGVTDDEVALPADANIGIVHPLHLGDELAAWAEIFADYEILQPFPQLGRPVHALTDEEKAARELTVFKNVTVPTGRVLGLTNRGWQRGEPGDGGVEWCVLRPVPGGRAVVVSLEPGIAVGLVDEFPEQKLDYIWLSSDGDGYWEPRKDGLTFAELDPVTASEVLTELCELTGTTR